MVGKKTKDDKKQTCFPLPFFFFFSSFFLSALSVFFCLVLVSVDDGDFTSVSISTGRRNSKKRCVTREVCLLCTNVCHASKRGRVFLFFLFCAGCLFFLFEWGREMGWGGDFC